VSACPAPCSGTATTAGSDPGRATLPRYGPSPRALLEVGFDPDFSATTHFPARGYPARSDAWTALVVTGAPGVPMAIPALVAGGPDEFGGRRGRPGAIHHRRRRPRRRFDDDLFLRRRRGRRGLDDGRGWWRGRWGRGGRRRRRRRRRHHHRRGRRGRRGRLVRRTRRKRKSGGQEEERQPGTGAVHGEEGLRINLAVGASAGERISPVEKRARLALLLVEH
jgi:hypothetical protein